MTDCIDWFVRYPNAATDAPLRLFAFPFAGGSPFVYRDWGGRLRRADVYSALLPGRGRRLGEPPLGDMRLLIARMIPAFLNLADRPFALFGHSMGALLAYELASRLRDHGICPLHLFVSAYRSPERPNPNRVLHLLPEAEFVNELRGYGGAGVSVLDNSDLTQIMLPMVRADFRLHETYTFTARPRLTCPVTAIVATQDRYVTENDMAGWADKTDGTFTLMRVEGAHFSILENASPVLARVQHCIDSLTAY